ncbi:MAG: alpha/beta fold hydrolase [Acidimicrobiia bacterium]|nr:alpha/beta fold hydrolase [Acidimicrobiia bacterium]
MTWNGNDTESAAVRERGFGLEVDGRLVPGVSWQPASGGADRLVLLGHGGTTHKKIDYIEELAAALAAKGIATMAIDGPGHGDRAVDLPSSGHESDQDRFAELWSSGGGTAGMLADWRAALDFIEAEEGPRPTGWWGLSMGTMMGLPVAATDPRIRVAVLGLMGTWGPNGSDLAALAGEVSCPLRFLVQWDDEIVPRDACLELFGLLGTTKKSLHANPGAHAEVPRVEVASSVGYLDRYLG